MARADRQLKRSKMREVFKNKHRARRARENALYNAGAQKTYSRIVNR